MTMMRNNISDEELMEESIASVYVLHTLNKCNSGLSQEEFYSANIIDATNVTETDMHNNNDNTCQFIKDNGCYAALPPFEEGSFIDGMEKRYIHWKILDIGDDYFRLKLDHYPNISFHNPSGDYIEDFYTHRYCWYLACSMTVKVKVLNDEEHMQMISHHPDFVRNSLSMCNGDRQKQQMLLRKLSKRLKSEIYIGGIIEDCEYYMPQDFRKLNKKGKYYTESGEYINATLIRDIIDVSKEHASRGMDYALHTMKFVSTGPLLEMFTYINCMLSQKTTTSSTLRQISSVYAPTTDNVELRKERHFGKLTIVSEKKPRSVNVQNVQRVYTMASWQRRGHLRHLASGKVVPVKSAVCNRRGAENIPAPQVIYTV